MDTVIAAMDANHHHLTTQKIFYVEISLARNEAELVTNDKQILCARLEAITDESVAALEAADSTREKLWKPGSGVIDRRNSKNVSRGSENSVSRQEQVPEARGIAMVM